MTHDSHKIYILGTLKWTTLMGTFNVLEVLSLLSVTKYKGQKFIMLLMVMFCNH